MNDDPHPTPSPTANRPATTWPVTAVPAADNDETTDLAELLSALGSLRQDVKLQVRSNRALQELLQGGFQRIEHLFEQRTPSRTAEPTARLEELRALVEAVVEIEEGLQRAIDALAARQHPTPSTASDTDVLLAQWDREVAASPWWSRMLASRLLQSLRQVIASHAAPPAVDHTIMDATQQGLQLLLARLHRLMQQSELERVNVYAQPFDAETMQATDFVAGTTVPSAHVAEQLRPLYRWRGKVFRCAQVRLAK